MGKPLSVSVLASGRTGWSCAPGPAKEMLQLGDILKVSTHISLLTIAVAFVFPCLLAAQNPWYPGQSIAWQNAQSPYTPGQGAIVGGPGAGPEQGTPMCICRAMYQGSMTPGISVDIYFPNSLSRKPAMMPSASFDSGKDTLFQKACVCPSKTTSRASSPAARNLR